MLISEKYVPIFIWKGSLDLTYIVCDCDCRTNQVSGWTDIMQYWQEIFSVKNATWKWTCYILLWSHCTFTCSEENWTNNHKFYIKIFENKYEDIGGRWSSLVKIPPWRGGGRWSESDPAHYKFECIYRPKANNDKELSEMQATTGIEDLDVKKGEEKKE